MEFSVFDKRIKNCQKMLDEAASETTLSADLDSNEWRRKFWFETMCKIIKKHFEKEGRYN